MITGQLLPSQTSAPGPQPDSAASQNGGPPAPPRDLGCVVCRLTVKSTSSEMVAAIENDQASWLHDVSGGHLGTGLSMQRASGGAGTGSLPARVAQLRSLYAVNPEQAQLRVTQDDARSPDAFETILAQQWQAMLSS